MEVRITREDVIYGYLAQFFNYGTGLLILPFILHELTAAEVGMNYVMLSVGTLANIADLGFAGQIGRNVTYVLSGARVIYKDEIGTVKTSDNVDYGLLKTIIDASKFLYGRISLVVLVLLISFGTLYMYHVTEGFSNVDNSIIIWILFAISTYFNLYFLYYNSLLTGAGLIKEHKMSVILSKVVYFVLCIVLIFAGLGLMGMVIANLVSPFVARYYCYKKFYSEEMLDNLPSEKTDRQTVIYALKDIWVTARKNGTNTIGHFVGTQGSTFIAGIYLPITATAQWGLMVQLFSAVQGLASSMCLSLYPEFCKLRLQGEKELYLKKSSLSVALMIVVVSLGGTAIMLAGPWLIELLKSETMLPSSSLMFVYFIYVIILTNAQLFAVMMSSRNVIPSPIAVLITTVGQILLTIMLLHYTGVGIWALLLGPAISGCSYTLWKWSELELKNLNISAFRFYSIGFKELFCYVKSYLRLLYPQRLKSKDR